MSVIANVFDKIFPPDEDPTLTLEQRDLKARERKHFVFAFVLILGAMLMLPISGIIYFVLMKLGIVPWPF